MWPSVRALPRLPRAATRRLASAAPSRAPAPALPNNEAPYRLPTRARAPLPTRRNPYRRTTALIAALREEEALRRVREGRAQLAARVPRPRAGMLIQVAYKSRHGPDAPVHYFTGVCIAAARRGLAASVLLRNVVDGVAVERAFPMYSPLVTHAVVLAHKKVSKSKLYYLRRKPLRESAVANPTQRPAAPKP